MLFKENGSGKTQVCTNAVPLMLTCLWVYFLQIYENSFKG